MNLLQISYFIALAENGSFKKTAEQMFVSQPAVSMQITALEKEWGMKLFNRMYKEVTLTPSGEVMYDMLARARSDYDFSYERAKQLFQDTRTVINIGMPEYFDLKGIDDVISDFHSTHPLVAVNLEVCPASELSLNRGKFNKFDLVITQKHLINNYTEIHELPIKTTNFTLNFQKDKQYNSKSMEEILSILDGKNLYAPSPTKTLTLNFIRDLCEGIGFSPGEIITYPNINSVMIAAKMGFGVALLDDGTFIPKELNLQSIKTEATIEWVLAWRKDNKKPYFKDLVSAVSKLCVRK